MLINPILETDTTGMLEYNERPSSSLLTPPIKEIQKPEKPEKPEIDKSFAKPNASGKK